MQSDLFWAVHFVTQQRRRDSCYNADLGPKQHTTIFLEKLWIVSEQSAIEMRKFRHTANGNLAFSKTCLLSQLQHVSLQKVGEIFCCFHLMESMSTGA